MMNREQALNFASVSADGVIDQKAEYEDSFLSHYINLIDTLNEHRASQYIDEARQVYVKRYLELLKNNLQS